MLNQQFKLEGKIQNGSMLKERLKQKFWKFEGQFDFEDQGQGHKFSNISETFR